MRQQRVVGLLSAAFGLVGAALVLFSTRHGPGLSPDSVNYLSAADSVASSGSFSGFLPGNELAAFAPFYPLMLVPGDALGAPLTGARITGALMFGLLVAAGVVGASRIARSWIVPALTGIALVLSIPLLGVSSFVWSDGAFALVVALFLLNVSTIGIRESAVALSGLLAGVATVTRYVGVTTIPIGVLAILRWGRRSRRLDLLLFLVLAVLPAAAWVARNLVVTSTLAGTRHSAADGLEVPIRDTGRTIGNWLFPGHPHAGLAVAAVLSLMALALVRRYPPVRLEVVAFFFCAVYVIWLLTSAASVALDPIDDRFLAPIYVPLTWLVVGIAGRLVSIAESRAARVSSLTALAVVAGAWAVLQASELGNLPDRVELSSLSGVPRWTKSDERRAHRMRDISTAMLPTPSTSVRVPMCISHLVGLHTGATIRSTSSLRSAKGLLPMVMPFSSGSKT